MAYTAVLQRLRLLQAVLGLPVVPVRLMILPMLAIAVTVLDYRSRHPVIVGFVLLVFVLRVVVIIIAIIIAVEQLHRPEADAAGRALPADDDLHLLRYRSCRVSEQAAGRNARVEEELLTTLPQYDAYHRQGRVIALAALGVVVDPGEVVRDPHDRGGLDAYAVALGIAPLGPAERPARLESLGTLVGLALRE